MAQEPMTGDRHQAGAQYLQALDELGFQPEAMLWAVNKDNWEFQLAIVSSLVDRVGTFDIYKVLFDAYDRAATPRDIDPFIVSLYSPKSVFAIFLKREMRLETRGSATGYLVGGGAIDLGEPWRLAGDYFWRESWVYVSMRRRPEAGRQLRQWETFKHNVERLAA